MKRKTLGVVLILLSVLTFVGRSFSADSMENSKVQSGFFEPFSVIVVLGSEKYFVYGLMEVDGVRWSFGTLVAQPLYAGAAPVSGMIIPAGDGFKYALPGIDCALQVFGSPAVYIDSRHQSIRVHGSVEFPHADFPRTDNETLAIRLRGLVRRMVARS